MPLFRFHRGSLEDSLKTVIIVKTFNDVVKAVVNCDLVVKLRPTWGAIFTIEPYPSDSNNFDPRIGWYTHAVKTNLYDENQMYIIGFLSGPLEDDSF